MPELAGPHHIHAWLLTSEQPHNTQATLLRIKEVAAHRDGIAQATAQIERNHCGDDQGGVGGGEPAAFGVVLKSGRTRKADLCVQRTGAASDPVRKCVLRVDAKEEQNDSGVFDEYKMGSL